MGRHLSGLLHTIKVKVSKFLNLESFSPRVHERMAALLSWRVIKLLNWKCTRYQAVPGIRPIRYSIMFINRCIILNSHHVPYIITWMSCHLHNSSLSREYIFLLIVRSGYHALSLKHSVSLGKVK